MPRHYNVIVLAFNNTKGYKPFGEIDRLKYDFTFDNPLPGMKVEPLKSIGSEYSKVEFSGYRYLDIGEDLRARMELCYSLIELINSNKRFWSCGTILDEASIKGQKIKIWELWQHDDKDYRVWIRNCNEAAKLTANYFPSIPDCEDWAGLTLSAFPGLPIESMFLG